MRLRTGLKYRKISYYECNWNLYNWLVAGSEPWVILRLFLIFQDLSLMILIKRILIKKRVIPPKLNDMTMPWQGARLYCAETTFRLSIALHK